MTATDNPMSYADLMRWIRSHDATLIHESAQDTPQGNLALGVVDALAAYQVQGNAENEAKLRKAVFDYLEGMQK